MSSRKGFLSVITLAGAVFLSGAAVMAQDVTATSGDKTRTEKREHGHHGDKMGRGEGGRRHGGHRGMGGRGFGMFRGIELSEAQKTQLKAIHEANMPDQATQDELKAIHTAKRDGTITEDQKARMQALREQMKAKHESVRSQMEAILTPEQKQQIETRKVEMKQNREERKQRWQERKKQDGTVKTTKDN